MGLELSGSDHDVQIVTTKGREMVLMRLVLMRLGDAIREVGATQGLQVHRSHCVALAHITAVKRPDDWATGRLGDRTTGRQDGRTAMGRF